jgi:glutathione S-transferase
MTTPIVFGAAYSVYVRAVRLTLEEKGVAYRHEDVDVFAEGGAPVAHLERQPFGKIPAFEHGGFSLYETGAITRYIDEGFAGPDLQPRAAQQRARVSQAISILDSYVYPTLVWTLYVEGVSKPSRGLAPDQTRIAKSMPRARTCLSALAALTDGAWLAGDQLSLADLHASPMFAYFSLAPQAGELMNAVPRLRTWWETVSSRPSMARTKPHYETEPLSKIR